MDISSASIERMRELSLGDENGGGGTTGIVDPSRSPITVMVHRSSTTSVYRQVDGMGRTTHGVKVTRDGAAARVGIENDRRVSDHLPDCCPKRRFIEVVEESSPSEDGSGLGSGGPSLKARFTWVSGVTLDEWLRDNNSCDEGGDRRRGSAGASDADAIKSRVRAAAAIARTLSDYHDAYGVSHGRLSSTNVLLETSPHDGEVTAANFVDLAEAVVLGEVDEDAGRVAKERDLGALGRVFRELFGGGAKGTDAVEVETRGGDVSEPRVEKPMEMMNIDYAARVEGKSDEEDETVEEGKRSKRGKPSTSQEQIIEELPLYTSSLISALLLNGSDDADRPSAEKVGGSYASYGEERYDSARAVHADLTEALVRFDVYFRPFNWAEATRWNHVPLPHDAFYGRKTETTLLLNSFHGVMSSGRPAMTAVTGHPGMGKTMLVNQINQTVEDNGGHLISGKFDIADGIRSDLVLFDALDNFFGQFVGRNDAKENFRNDDGADLKATRMWQRISDSVGFGIGDLIQSIPNLGKLIPDDYNSSRVTTTPPQQLIQRSKYILCQLIGAIADEDNPIVLVIDDLQWADALSLEVIQMLVTDPDIRYCLYLGCYRNHKEGEFEAVDKMMAGIKRQGVDFYTINLGPLEKESTNTLISEAMCLPPSLSKPLSNIIHTKTAGSPLFVKNFIGGGLIRVNLSTRRWEYSIGAMLKKETPESVVQYMKSQMNQLPLSYRLCLKLASCLGHHFDHSTFMRAKVRSDYDLVKVLPLVCQTGFLHELAPGKYFWTHDQVRQAAYELIPPDKRESFHLLIGTRILMDTDQDELENGSAIIFDILGCMNQGMRLIQSPGQRYEVAELNLIAGQTCIKTASFHSAAKFFQTGIRLLPPGECWNGQYDLTLKLHNSAQNALFATGNLATLNVLTSKVIANARNLDDKFNSYNNLIRYYLALDQLDKGVITCISVLKELGEELPSSNPIDERIVLKEFMAVGQQLSTYPGQALLQHSRMNDPRKLAAMEFLQSIFSATANAPSIDPGLSVLVILRLIKITLESGLCEASAVAFAAFSCTYLRGPMKDIDKAYYLGKLAIQIQNILESDKYKARVYTLIYGFTNIWKEPIQANLDKLLEGYIAGCVHGDMEYAYWNLQSYSGLALYSGQNLNMLQKNFRTYVKRAIQNKQMGAALLIVPFLSAACDLTGVSSEEDVYRTFFDTTVDVLLLQLATRKDPRATMVVLTNLKYSRLYCGDIVRAVQALEFDPNPSTVYPMVTMPVKMGIFTDGLIALECARRHGDKEQQWVALAKSAIAKCGEWEKDSAWNFLNKSRLLEAELAFFEGEDGLARDKYNASIAAARNHRFIHEEGLANACAARFHLRRGRRPEALQHFEQAKECYDQWGAAALVSCMNHEIEALAMTD